MMEKNKKWFVLIGILNKILSNDEVKELYQSGKVKIYGPYTDEEIKVSFESKKLIRENIIQKIGDTTWKPVHSYEDFFIRSLLAKDIFIEKKHGENKDSVVMVIHSVENPWKKILLFISLILFISAFAYYYYDNYYCDPKEFYKKLKKNVVVVYSLINNEVKGLGTGFFLKGSNLILTNLHVISKATDINIKGGDGKTYSPESVNFVDVINDLALIQVKENNVPEGLTFGDPDKVEEGDKIFVIGNPAGWELSLSEGIVSGKRNIDPITNENRETIQITAPISPGSSGSPVFNKRGKVIGVVSIGSGGVLQNLNFAASIKPVMNYKSYINKAYFKFLNREADWVYVDTVKGSYITSQDYFFTHKAYVSISLFFSPETVVDLDNGIKTVWVRENGNITRRIESNIFYDIYGDIDFSAVDYQLYEIDCKNMNYIPRIKLRYFNNSLQSITDNFGMDGSSTFQENSIIHKLCN